MSEVIDVESLDFDYLLDVWRERDDIEPDSAGLYCLTDSEVIEFAKFVVAAIRVKSTP